VQEPLLEDLFAAFRDQGDATALAAVFDRTAGELLTLALHLAPETSAAEDLVQATFLAAIQGASTFQRGRRLMPWLVGILANQAARARRDRARIIDPTRVEVRSEPDPALASEQREVLAALTRAIDGLPDTCREAVRRHLLEGERAVDIARAEGLAPGTVRMQILRGLERLRRTLPAGLLSALPVGVEANRMSAIRAVVMSASREHVGQIAAGTASSTASGSAVVLLFSAIGSVLMSIKIWLLLAAAVVVLLVSWSVVSGPDPSSTMNAERKTAPTIVSASSQFDAAAAAPHRTPATNSDPASSEFASGYRLSGQVRGLDGLAARDVVITVNELERFSVHADESGHYEVDLSKMFDGSGPSPYELGIFAKHPANREAEALISVSMPVAPGTRHPTEHSWNVDLVLKSFVRLTGKLELPKRMIVDLPWVALF
jgi:RNA polymerase sigma-70 factor (ECF subfamily)